MNDLRYAFRALRNNPGFTAIAILTLALGIGSSTSVFSVVEGTLLRSLPFPEAERLVDIKFAAEQYRDKYRDRGWGATSPFTAYEVWRSQAGFFEGMAAAMARQPVLTSLGDAERIMAWTVTSNFFPLLGATPILGRLFSPDDDRGGTAPMVVLSHRFWATRLGGDPQVLGRTITLDTTTYVVVGVMSPAFRYPADADVWLPLGTLLSGPAAPRLIRQFGWWVIGRLRPGVTPEGAQNALDGATRRSWVSDRGNTTWLPVIVPLHWYHVKDVRTPLWLMLGAVALVLLVACANVASLLFSRATARSPEMAVRRALGAGPVRIVRQSLTESVLVALAGGAVGLLLTFWTVPYLVSLAGEALPGVATIRVDVGVLAMCLGTSILAGLLSGLVPALQLSRAAVAEALKTGAGPGSALRRRRTWASDASLVLQSALTLVLLAGAGLLAMSFVRLVRVDPGFDTTHVLTAELRLPDTHYRTSVERAGFVRAALEGVGALPGVTSAAIASGIPMGGGSFGTVTVPGSAQEPQTPAWFAGVTPEYFRTMGIPLLRGSVPEESTSRDALRVVIDEAAAREYLRGESPLGQRITFRGGSSTGTIIGVVSDTKQESLDDPPPPHIYYSLLPEPPAYLKVVLRVSGEPAALAESLREAIRRVDAGVPIDRIATMEELLSESLTRQRFYGLLLAVFAGCALALAAAGMFGAASYAVAQRTREFGLRIALGAKPKAVVSLIVGRGLRLAVAGILLGLLGAVAGTRLLRGFLFEVEPTDPWVLTSVGVLLAGVVLFASYLPARRAVKIDPMVALRYE